MNRIVGEGTYGCVIKPSMTCEENGTVEYANKVSKVMLEKNAKKEYEEMQEITSLPGIEKYVVSMVHMCKPRVDTNFLDTVGKCKNPKLRKNNPKAYRLLIMDDGGITIQQFATNLVSTLTKKDVCIFLSKIYHLMEGLCFFHNNNIIHHDIHAKNIVYNIETAKIRFIDFGLMRKASEFINENMKNKNETATTGFNFPPEYKCANRKEYDACGYSLPYNKYVERLAYTFDWYSFGLMMQDIIKDLSINTDVLPHETLEAIYSFFTKLAEPNIERRVYDINKQPEVFKGLLKSFDAWCSENVVPTPSASSIQLQKQLNGKLLGNKKSDRVSLLKTFKKVCPEGYVLDRDTRRCLKKCKTGFIRNNATKRCRKRKQSDEKKKN
jgi:serine/threonine protein kinase